VIDYRSQDVIETLKSGKEPYDLIVDNVFATPALYWNCQHYLNPSGRFVTIAGSPTIGSLLDLLKVFLWPRFLGGGQRPIQFVTAQTNASDYEMIAKWMAEGKVKAVIEKEFELEKAAEAFKHLKTGRTKGKLVIKVCEEEPPRN
jgi:NADPH:quinone reductase-like Zn-dependent oxidoreductase